MFTIELHGTDLYINGFRILDLKKPFHRIVGDSKGVAELLRTPSESLSRKKKPLTYYVKFSETKMGALFHSEVAGLQCHWVYNTNTGVSPLFRDKALLTLLTALDTPLETYTEVRRYLTTILTLLWNSFSFDCIFTSLSVLPSLLPGIPVCVAPLRLMTLPKPAASFTSRQRTLHAVLRGHPEGIPLSLLTGESYNFLSLRHTSFEKSSIKNYKSMLVVEGTNTAYSGFLARELTFLGVKEVLPVCLFHIGT
jgi:hypothetical protein